MAQESDLDAEGAVLGGLLCREISLVHVPRLEYRHFFSVPNGIIFSAVETLERRGKPWDVVSVAGLLNDRGKLKKVGGTEYLATLTNQPSVAWYGTPDVAISHAERVIRLWRWREGRRCVMEAAARLGQDPTGPVVTDLVERLEELGFRRRRASRPASDEKPAPAASRSSARASSP